MVFERIRSIALLASLWSLAAGCQTSHSERSSWGGRSIIEQFETSDFGGSFVDYWIERSAAKPGLATVLKDPVAGSFQVVLRTIDDDRTLHYDVYERPHRSEEITYRSFRKTFDAADHVPDVMSQLVSMIERTGSSGDLVVVGGPGTKNHLVTKTGRNVGVPFAGYSSGHYEALEDAADSPALPKVRLPQAHTRLEIANIEILINQLDALGDAVRQSSEPDFPTP